MRERERKSMSRMIVHLTATHVNTRTWKCMFMYMARSWHEAQLTPDSRVQEDRKLSKSSLKRTLKKFFAGKLRVIGGNDADEEEA